MKVNRFLRSVSVLSLFVLIIVVLFTVSQVIAKDTPNPNSKNPNVTYQTIPISMQMEAGVPYHLTGPSPGYTVHSGSGWILPLGRATYVGGVGYLVADNYKPSFMWTDPATMNPAWKALFGTSLFCIYSLPDGDIYAWDGVMGNVQPVVGDDGKMDYLVNVIVGGTGRYKNATGMLLGRTPGRGDDPDSSLPLSLIKIMEGYINIQVKESKYKTALPSIGTQNPQKWPDAEEDFAGNVLIPINIEMEAGNKVWKPWTSGTTMIAGMGWVEPFGRAEYYYQFPPDPFDEDTDALKPDFIDDSSWGDFFHAKNLCIYELDGGSIYSYGGIAGNLVPDSADGKIDFIIEVIVGGDGDYAGATGMMLGYTSSRGAASIPSDGSKSGPVPLPNSLIKIMEGYVVKK